MLVENSSEFVDLILGCEGILQERRQLAGNDVYRFRWECRAQGIEAWMAHDPEGPLVEVWDVADATMIAARANRLLQERIEGRSDHLRLKKQGFM